MHGLALDDGAVGARHVVRHARRHERVLVHEAHGAQVRWRRVVTVGQERGLLHASHFWKRRRDLSIGDNFSKLLLNVIFTGVNFRTQSKMIRVVLKFNYRLSII